MRSRNAWVDRAGRLPVLAGAVVSSIGVLCGAALARADEAAPLGSAQLQYSRGRGADSCPDETALAAEVILRLGYDPFQRVAPRTLEVAVNSDGAQLRATITLVEPGAGPSTHRLVSSALDCSVLRPALGLAIALAIDPARALAVDVGPTLPAPRPPAPFPQPLPTRAPEPLRARIEPSPSSDATGRRLRQRADDAPFRRRGTLYGGAYAAVAAAPTTTGGLELGGTVVYRYFSIGAELRGDLPVGGGGAEVGRVLVEGVPCFRTLAFGFGICALAAVGVTIARGHGHVVDRQVALPYAGLGARLMVEIPLSGRVALGLHADVLGLVTRASLRVDSDVIYRDAPATGAFGVNVVGRFGDGS